MRALALTLALFLSGCGVGSGPSQEPEATGRPMGHLWIYQLESDGPERIGAALAAWPEGDTDGAGFAERLVIVTVAGREIRERALIVTNPKTLADLEAGL